MSREITIPAAALEAGARQICGYERDQEVDWREYIGHARAAFLAMTEAWPNRVTVKDDGRRQTYIIPAIILPLPTEAT